MYLARVNEATATPSAWAMVWPSPPAPLSCRRGGRDETRPLGASGPLHRAPALQCRERLTPTPEADLVSYGVASYSCRMALRSSNRLADCRGDELECYDATRYQQRTGGTHAARRPVPALRHAGPCHL